MVVDVVSGDILGVESEVFKIVKVSLIVDIVL